MIAPAAQSDRAAVALPRRDRFFELRFESIGGLGAHAAGQILASAAVLRMGLNGAHFSSYGSEKKGSAVRSFVRLGRADRPVRTSAPVEAPDAIVVFHAALLDHPLTFAGLRADGTVIVALPRQPSPDSRHTTSDVFARLPRTARVMLIDALGIAVAEKSRPNAVLLGAICTAFPFLERAAVLDALATEFAGKHPEAVAANERAFRRGEVELQLLDGVGRADGDVPIARPQPVWGFETQPIGGVIPEPGNTIWNDLSTSRTGWLPVLDAHACIHCGTCDLVCPDYCLVWGPGDAAGRFARMLRGIDYRYCKGCLRCVESCPTGALEKTAETPGLARARRVPLFPELLPQEPS
jgi:pyruvate ferredoxin oxidoreductase gamma subunit